jgi:hypothetical protein
MRALLLMLLLVGCSHTTYKTESREILNFGFWDNFNIEFRAFGSEVCIGCLETLMPDPNGQCTVPKEDE